MNVNNVNIFIEGITQSQMAVGQGNIKIFLKL